MPGIQIDLPLFFYEIRQKRIIADQIFGAGHCLIILFRICFYEVNAG